MVFIVSWVNGENPPRKSVVAMQPKVSPQILNGHFRSK